MADQWKGFATSAMYALDQGSAEPFGPTFGPALGGLCLREAQMTTLARGHFVRSQDIIRDGPGENLGRASRALARYGELHHRAVRIFSMYGGVLGVLTDGPLSQGNPPPADPLWQNWVKSKDAVFTRADKASQRLRSVAAYDLATLDAFHVAQSFPDKSQDWKAWMRAADNLSERAEAEGKAASSSEGHLSCAVFVERRVASAILNR